MFKFTALLTAATLFMNINAASAYDFAKIDTLFDLLQTEYTGNINLKQLTLKSGAALTKLDENLRLYYSDSKAFLYEQDHLIGTFVLPEDKTLSSWKQSLTDILKKGTEYSVFIAQHASELENEVLRIVTDNLDSYSRIGQISSPQHSVVHSFKDNILYIKAETFAKDCSDTIRNIISQYPLAYGLILDLRGNTGGNFGEAIKTADLFLDGALITSSSEKNEPTHYYTATSGDIFTGRPIVILTNEYTASAAEIVTAALSEQSRATIIGTKTYGKGSIQHIYQVDNKKLYLTSGYFFSPSGKEINQQGITPQICTGINNSCIFSDSNNPQKDIAVAINFIKKNFG